MSGVQRTSGLASMLAALGCASQAAPPPSAPVPVERTEAQPEPPGVEDDALARACGVMAEVRSQGRCADLEYLQMDEAQCRQSFAEERAGMADAKREALDGVFGCVAGASACEAVLDCWAALAMTAGSEERTCGDGAFGPLSLAAEDAAKRYGQGATKFSAAPTTKELPIEVCGVKGEVAWLLKATCDDGKPAFASFPEAYGTRAGSVGGGGRCGHVIDLYKVSCPEGAYDVFMDMYMCGPSEEF